MIKRASFNNGSAFAVLATLFFGAFLTARAQSDLYVGFNDATGPSTAQNDYVIDIGPYSSLTNAAGTNGGTIDLMSASAPNQISASTFSSTITAAYGTDSDYLNEVAAGVVGGQTGSNPKDLWQTMPTSVTTPSTINGSGLRAAAGDVLAPVVTGEYSSTTASGWSDIIAASPTLAGNNGAGSEAGSSHNNPMGYLSSGSVTLNLWQNTTASGSSTTVSGWTNIGYFTFNVSTPDITFTLGANSGPPPPPTPTIGSVFQSGGNLVITGANGTDNGQYRILMGTNLSIPSTNWTPVWTSSFSATGTYSYTNSLRSAVNAYFRIVAP